MNLLGDQLIRDAGVAVFELVKNAYDADASVCSVTLENVVSGKDARIVIEDNGQGMDLETITDVWMVPGTDNKKQQREAGTRTPKFKRLPLGEKGVGRFAVHKLGTSVLLVTRASKQQEVVVHLDWRQFDDAEFLDQVPIKIATRDPEVFKGAKTGTRIEVTELRDPQWTRRQVRTLHRAVTAICSPFETPDHFDVEFELKPKSDWLDGLLKVEEVQEHALFHFKAAISGDQLVYDYDFRPGKRFPKLKARPVKGKTMTLAREKERGQKTIEPLDLARHKIGNVGIEFYIYDLEPGTLKLDDDAVGLRDYMAQNGGVRVYRDGVRVYDFGEQGNDWLDLGGRRVNIPARRIGNNQILGGVFLDSETSTALREKTNREGFIESGAYEDFRAAIRFALRQAETERNVDKTTIRQHQTSGKGDAREPVLGDLETLRQLAKKQDLSSEFLRLIDRIEVQYREALDKLLVAAGAGLNLSAVLHEVEKGISSLRSALESEEPQQIVASLAKHLADMVDGLTWLVRQTGKTKQAASAIIKQALFNWSFRFEAHKVEVMNGILKNEDEDFSVRCSRRLITTALANLIDNAIYWLVHDPKKKKRMLYIGTVELDGKPGIVVADNGPGFDDPPEYLVQPFFTRKPDGMGLGLHITDEIMHQHGGQLVFPAKGDVDLPSGYNGAVLVLQFAEEA
jgi:signal transduction histidine kinase